MKACSGDFVGELRSEWELTIARVMQLADERNLSLFKLSQLCDVSYSTLKNAEMRGSQLGVPTIERICVALGVTLSDFFAESDSV